MKQMSKRVIALMLVMACVLILAACSSETPPANGDNGTTATTAAQNSGDDAPQGSTTAAPATTTTKQGNADAEINVRSGPGFDYESIGGVLKGEAIVIVGREGDWYKIKFGDGYGYINAQYVAVDGSPNASQMQEARPTTTTAATTGTDTSATGPDGSTSTTAQGVAVGDTTTTTFNSFEHIPGISINDAEW